MHVVESPRLRLTAAETVTVTKNMKATGIVTAAETVTVTETVITTGTVTAAEELFLLWISLYHTTVKFAMDLGDT